MCGSKLDPLREGRVQRGLVPIRDARAMQYATGTPFRKQGKRFGEIALWLRAGDGTDRLVAQALVQGILILKAKGSVNSIDNNWMKGQASPRGACSQ